MKKGKVLKVPKNLLPSPKKIATRGLYEILSGTGNHRDYGKRVKRGRI